MNIDFCGEAYVSRDTNQETINLYPEINTKKKVEVLVNTPGMDKVASISLNPVRGLHIVSKNESFLYGVFGNEFYSIDVGYYAKKLGTLQSSEGLVDIKDNGSQIIIVDGLNIGYLYTISSGEFVQINGGDSAAFIDGYFIVNENNSQVVRSSGLYDGKTWNALDRASAEGDPDNIVRVSSKRTELWLHGTLSTEIWYDAGIQVGFPFQRMAGAVIEFGLSAKWSLVHASTSHYQLARTDKGERIFIEVSNYNPTIISHPGINYEIGKLENISDAESFAYTQEGHTFYVTTFPSGDITFVYDISTGRWHRRQSYGMGRWQARCYAFFQGKHIVGSFKNGNLYSLSMDTYSEDSEPLVKVRTARELIDYKEDYKNIFVNEIQLDMQLGLGNDKVEDPVAVMQTSRDNGKTWGPEHIQPLMKSGKFRSRIMWHRWGKARRRLFKLIIADPVKVVIRGAWIDAQKGIN